METDSMAELTNIVAEIISALLYNSSERTDPQPGAKREARPPDTPEARSSASNTVGSMHWLSS